MKTHKDDSWSTKIRNRATSILSRVLVSPSSLRFNETWTLCEPCRYKCQSQLRGSQGILKYYTWQDEIALRTFILSCWLIYVSQTLKGNIYKFRSFKKISSIPLRNVRKWRCIFQIHWLGTLKRSETFAHFRKVATNFSGFEKLHIRDAYVRCVVFIKNGISWLFPTFLTGLARPLTGHKMPNTVWGATG